jgi:DNA polymerase III subunit delta
MKIPELFALVGGDDEFLTDRQAQEWFNTLKSTYGDGVETEIVDGRASTVGDVESCISRFMQAGKNMSLFGDRKIVWLRQTNFLGDNPTGRAEGTKNALQNITAWLETFTDPNTYILISGSPIDRRKGFYKFFEKLGHLFYLPSGKNTNQLLDLAQKECIRHGVRIEEEAALMLIARIGGNTRMMMNEIEKLSTYLESEDPKIITYSLVNEMVSQYGETEFFELADAFYNFNLEKALQSVRKHFFTHKDARPVLSSLQNRNRILIQLRSLKDGRWIDLGGQQLNKNSMQRAQQAYETFFEKADQKSEFHPFGQNPWYLGRLASIANTIPLRILIDFQMKFIATFARMIDHPNEQEQLIRDLVIDCHEELAG